MEIRVQAAPGEGVTPEMTAGVRARSTLPLAIGVLSGIAAVAALLNPAHVVNPGGSAALATTIALSAIVTAGLAAATFERSRELPDLLLLYALLALAFYDATATVTGATGLASDSSMRLAWQLIVAVTLAAGVLTPRARIHRMHPALATCAVAAGASVVALAALVEHLVRSNVGHALRNAGTVHTAAHPFALFVHTTSAAILIVSALALLARSQRGGVQDGLLAGALLLLAGESLQYLVTPMVATDWVTSRGGLELAAYVLLLGTVYGRYERTQRHRMNAAVSSERQRIVRDLHDGLAQDLACIAAQGQRLSCQLGPEHPLMVATRHALAGARGVVADLIASSAPTTEAALRLIADDLERRYDLEVQVTIESDSAATVAQDLEPSQRENLVRIAREAIVNAALHGAARHVDVVLLRGSRDLVLRISDDGSGITDTARTGFGLRTMRARAASLGGQLSAHPRAGGGTELELVVP